MIVMKRYKRTAALIAAIGLFFLVFIWSALDTRSQKNETYSNAIEQIEDGDYETAIEQLKTLGLYQDAKRYIVYAQALQFEEEGRYKEAAELFRSLEEFEDSANRAESIETVLRQDELAESIYEQALEAYGDGDYYKAYQLLTEIDEYKNSAALLKDSIIKANRMSRSHTISAGIQCSAGVTNRGTVLLSGKNFAGESEILKWTDIASVSASNEILAGLKNDGSVVIAKRKQHYAYRIDVSEWSDIIDVAVGEQYIVGLRADGTLTAQGIDGYGETDIDEWTDIIQIDTGWQHTVGLDNAGNVHIAGLHAETLLREIADKQNEWTNIISISTGGSSGRGTLGKGHVVGLRADGTVVAAGDNSFGQCNVEEWSDIIAVSAGDYHTVGLKSDGTVVTTQGENDFPETCAAIKDWTNITAVSAGYGYTLALKADGSVQAAGFDQDGQSDVSDWANILIRNEWKTPFIINSTNE